MVIPTSTIVCSTASKNYHKVNGVVHTVRDYCYTEQFFTNSNCTTCLAMDALICIHPDVLSVPLLRGMVSSVLGHFGPFLRTEMTKDRTGPVISVLGTELHIKRTDLHMHFGNQTSVSGRMCIDGVIVTLDSDNL